MAVFIPLYQKIKANQGKIKADLFTNNVIHFSKKIKSFKTITVVIKKIKKCGTKKKNYQTQVVYFKEKVAGNWTAEFVIGRVEKRIECSIRTLYRWFKDSDVFGVSTLPMKGKRKPNSHKEKHGK